MNNEQSSGASTNQLNTTGNPQNVGTPVLLPSSGNLQGLAVTSNNLNTSGTSGIRLSGGQAVFTPDTTPPAHSFGASPYLIGGSVMLLLIAGIVIMVIRRGSQTGET